MFHETALGLLPIPVAEFSIVVSLIILILLCELAQVAPAIVCIVTAAFRRLDLVGWLGMLCE
jgi:hypothetical protein